MSKVAHTPGPWSVIDNNWDFSSVYGPDDCLIAEVQIHSSVTEENQHELEPVKEANARLIAAAPELLSALKMAQVWLKMALVWLDADGRFDMQGINAAIAKAEGRQP